MKKFVYSIAALFIMSLALNAQVSERELTKELKDKAIREARKEAKKYKKDGWEVNPGGLPLAKLLETAWKKQLTPSEDGQPLYITADGNGVAETKTAAEMQAIEMGKLQLAGQLETNINSLISGNIANAQLNAQDAASVTEIVQSSKNIIATQLGYVDPFFKVYRNLKGKKIEVQVKLFYDRTQSMEIARKVVQKELKDKLKINEQQLEKLMGLDQM